MKIGENKSKLATGQYVNIWRENAIGGYEWDVYVIFIEAAGELSAEALDIVEKIVNDVMEKRRILKSPRTEIARELDEVLGRFGCSFYETVDIWIRVGRRI